ncbi:alpha-2-macroglobulin family protein [Neptuniibacter caesariensis]|uniref:Alpha-2-macroglobulin n=1 Tax=Neptuniibacter caesariensis TaxID=207954 RepID=A0A7U8C5V4_NEPCE|nr:alpha-2-macroglobulin [Neptuniibacter caesariensis]EAR60441.1 putative lipoprotein [Oceanospirillum sp. MED92] [Neptuniibacter caesariensis]
MLSPRRALSVLLLTALLFGCGDDTETAKTDPIPSEQSSSLNTAANTDLAVLDISEREFGNLNAIAVLFNTPVDSDQRFSKYINVEPELPAPVLSEDGKTLYFTGITPQSEYQVAVSEGLQSANGKALQSAIEKTVKTRALPASIAFEVDGAVMIPGRVSSLPILAVNIPKAQVDIYAIKQGDSVTFFDEYSALKTGDRWYFNEQRFSKTLTHIHSAHIKIAEEKNRRNRVSFAVSKVPELKEGGLYLATVRAEGGFEYAATWFTVSSLGIQARDYGKITRYTVQNAENGNVLEGVELNLLDHNNQVIASGVTDSQGAWELSNKIRSKNPVLLIAEKAGEVSVLKYHAPQFDLSEFSVSGRPYRSVEHLTYAPRDIYRPGEELIVSSIVRNGDGQLLAGSLNIELIKPDGDKAGEWRLDPEQPGYFEFRYDLAENAPLGQWQVRAFSPGQRRNSSFFHFQVEEFLPERLRLVFDQPANEAPLSFLKHSELRIPVTGEYLYGAPAAGNRLDTQVSVSGWSQPFSELKDFRFGEAETVAWDQFSLDQVQLDPQGKTETIVSKGFFNWDNYASPVKMTLRYSLFESGGRAVNRSQSVLLWPKDSFIGVKPLFKNDRADKESSALFELVRANEQGGLLTSGQGKATLYRLEEKYFWSYTAERGWHYQTEKNEYPVANQIIDFTSADKVPLSLDVEWGKYRLELEDYSAKSKTVYHFNAGEDWYYNWHSGSDQIRPDQISIALDKGSYKAGETAQIKLLSPTEGKALVLLEAGGVLASQVVSLKEGKASAELTIPIDLARHDAYITAFVIAPSDNSDKVSKRSFGAVHLPLNREGRKLDVEIVSGDTLSPEASSEIAIKVTDAAGSPVSGEYFVTLSAVDSGVLSITGYEQPDPFDFFYQRRAYNTRISDMYDHLAEPTLVDEAEVRWGGDAELERGGEAPPTDVQILSLFSSTVQVEGGLATVNLDLPAFDGELTLTAVAMGADQFGYQKDSVKVVSPLVAQLSSPRFMAKGDRTRVALDLVNMTEATQQVSLDLSVSGALSMPERNLQLTLEPAKKKVLHFEIDAAALGEGDIEAAIVIDPTGEEPLAIERQWGLNVRPAYPAEYGSFSALLQEGNTLELPTSDIALLGADSRRAQLRFSSSPDFNADQHIEALLRYPYACLEQTTSKVQPLTMLAEDKGQLLASVSLDQADLTAQVGIAVNRYAELQRANGSFGLWDKHSAEEHWLTVYATELLGRLQKQGYEIPEEMLPQARNRLREYVLQRRAIPVRTWSAIPSHYEIAYQAYAAFVLAKEGAVTLGPLRDLADKKLKDAHSSLPGVHLGLAILMTGSKSEGSEIVSGALQTLRSEGYLGDYGSEIRDLSLSVAAVMATQGGGSELRGQALQLIPRLLTQIQQKRWLSTQERAALLQLAVTMNRYDKAGNWSAGLHQGEQLQEIQGEEAQRHNLDIKELRTTLVENLSAKPVFATFSWTGIPETIAGPVDEGISLKADHYKVVNGKATLLQKNQLLSIGDQVLTRVRLYSESRIPDALLVNLLPAGLELENQNLKHAIKLESLMVEGESIQQSGLAYQEYRDDRYVAAFNLPEKREKTLYYLSRAVTPGEYLVPPAQAESMYQPDIRGLSDSMGKLVVVE